MTQQRRPQRFMTAAVLLGVVALIVTLLPLTPINTPSASAQGAVVISEVVADNDTNLDGFGLTPDWLEIRNDQGSAQDLTGWTLTDGSGASWPLPGTTLAAGATLFVWASGRNINVPELHTNFSLSSTGETITIADASGMTVDSLTYPALAGDQAYGRSPASQGSQVGFLLVPTPDAANSAVAPPQASILTPGQVFTGSINVVMVANLAAGSALHYTTDDTAVTAASPVYSGPLALTLSTRVRSAVVDAAGVVGPEVTETFVGVDAALAAADSDLPMVILHAGATPNTSTESTALAAIIDVDAGDGRAEALDEVNFAGLTSLKVRGASSASAPKKQYKFEIWSDPDGTETNADLLDLGSESDWVLYGPGLYDRALINNALVYDLGHSIGVDAPDYKWVELWMGTDPASPVDQASYLGLYMLRENIKIGDERVDIARHPAGGDGSEGGYILRYDWNDACCWDIKPIVNVYPSRTPSLEVSDPNALDITPAQQTWVTTWWNELEAAAGTGNFAAIDPYIDIDNLIDGWLIEMIAMDVDVLRASTYFHVDAGGQLRAGPLWDYDRSMGAADTRVDDIVEAEAWEPNGNSGHSWNAFIYRDLWVMPEIQALIRARWAELRSAEFSDASFMALIDGYGSELNESWPRNSTRWSNYPDRFGTGMMGELDHTELWLLTKLAWLDDQFLTVSPAPVVTNPGIVLADEDVPVSEQIVAADPDTFVFDAEGLPPGLEIDPITGLITGTVIPGDGGIYSVTVTVTDENGASASVTFDIEVRPALVGDSALVLNEYNAVVPGQLLGAGGADSYFGQVTGNGGNWLELVTLEDNLDMRNWRLEMWSDDNDGAPVLQTTLEFNTNPVLEDLRSGTIVTVAQSVADDLSYNPALDDWTLNFQSNTSNAGAAFSVQSDFDTNNTGFRLVVRDEFGLVRAIVGGETDAWRLATGRGVASDEAFVLGVDPSISIDPIADYDDRTDSTFGEPNPTTPGAVQDLDAIRPVIVVPGDVNCSGLVDLVDARMVAQYTVLLLGGGQDCPPLSGNIYEPAGDANADSMVAIDDARIIVQCSVNISNVLCP